MDKRHSGFIIASFLLLLLFFPLSFSTSGSPQATSETGQPSALTADSCLPFDPREVVEQSSSAAPVDPLVSSYTTIAVASDYQREPRVAYNSTDNTYLVVWEDIRDSSKYHIYGQRVDADGSLLGSNIVIFSQTYNTRFPDVAYSSTSNYWLVVFQFDYYGDWDIACRRVNSDGSLAINTYNVSKTTGSDQQNPRVAYNSTENNFCVVWDDDRGSASLGWDIYSRIVTGNEAPTTSQNGVVVDLYNQRRPAIAYLPSVNGYLVAWDDNYFYSDTGWDIWCCRADKNGISTRSFTPVSKADEDQYLPVVAANTADNNFLVVWEDYRNGPKCDIYGQRMSSADNPAQVGSEIAMCTQSADQFDPAVCYSPTYNRYLVAWEDLRPVAAVADIYGRRFQNVKAFGAVNPNGEIDVRVADLNLDGNPEMVVAHGSGGKSWIKIFNYDGTLYNSIKCFGASNTGGQVHLAVGDFDADPLDLEIAVATGRNGTSQVKVFETYGTVKASFKAYGAANAEGEVYLAAADFDGDGTYEIITGTGIGGNSKVKIFDKDGTFQSSFYAFGSENTQGSIHLAAGNFDAITADKEIAVATGQGGTNTVKLFEENGTLIDSFLAFGSAGNPNGSVHISAVKIGAFAGLVDEILCGQGYGGNSWVKLFNNAGTLIRSFKAYGATNANGEVYVSGCRSH